MRSVMDNGHGSLHLCEAIKESDEVEKGWRSSDPGLPLEVGEGYEGEKNQDVVCDATWRVFSIDPVHREVSFDSLKCDSIICIRMKLA